LTITGPASGLTIRRRNTDPQFRILRVDAGGDVTLTNLTLQKGSTNGGGGGVINTGSLALVNTAVSDNSAHQGGGIYNSGLLSLTNSFASRNSADFGAGIDNHGRLTLERSSITSNSGGGIFNHDNQLVTLTNSNISQNSGGGVANSGGTLKLTDVFVIENTGGGISQNRGTSTLDHVRVEDNSTTSLGGGIFVFQSSMTIRNSTVSGNSAADGGGIANRDGGDLKIRRSTIVGNSATDRGGGIFNQVHVRVAARVDIVNSTVSGNSARLGGGIYNSGFLDVASASITNSTIAHNFASDEGGGVRQEFDEASISLKNTLIALDTAPSGPDALIDPEGASGASFSLIGDGSGSGFTNSNGNLVGTHSSPIDPKIGPLADNGGLTRTHALLAGSPAINAASSTACPAIDQRGTPRPQGAGCDIGSFERK
jgi:hypothetical protein